MIKWCKEISSGMNYISVWGMIHRDLAARNCLLDDDCRIKIADFGLTRELGAETRAYLAKSDKPRAEKWTAPESLINAVYTVYSDVWSYGVTIWEIFSYGAEPYGRLKGQKLITSLMLGERLPRPDTCPDAVYRIMQKCWHQNPNDRPTFLQIETLFEHITFSPSGPLSHGILLTNQSRCYDAIG